MYYGGANGSLIGIDLKVFVGQLSLHLRVEKSLMSSVEILERPIALELKMSSFLAVLCSSKCLISLGDHMGDLHSFDTKTGKLVKNYKSHKHQVSCLQIVDDGIYTGAFDGRIIHWDIKVM